MNDDKTHFDSSQPADPGLEARVVAWALGEASPFEAAELERRCAAVPELAVFKRRIEAVHGLLGEAARPVGAAWRLAPERRAALLEKLKDRAGLAGTSAHGEPAPGSATVGGRPARPAETGREKTWFAWTMPMAACVALGGLLAAIVLSQLKSTFGSAPTPASSSVAYFKLSENDALMAREEPIGQVAVNQPSPLVSVVESRVSGFGDKDGVIGDAYGLDVSTRSAAAARVPATPAPAAAPAQEQAKQVADFETRGARRGLDELSGGGIAMNGMDVNGSLADDSRLGGLSAEMRRRHAPRDRSSFGTGSMVEGSATALFGRNESLSRFDAKPVELERKQEDAVREAQAGVTGVTGTSDLSGYRWGEPGPGLASGGEGPALQGAIEKLKDLPAERPAIAAPAPDESLRAEVATQEQAVSTFSLHVGDVSFQLAKAALERGAAPDPATIRPEEFYNAFDYGDPAPAAGEAVACRAEQAAHPFLQQRNLVRVALRVPAAGRGAGTPLNLTVLLDTSGSMEREDRAATVRAALGSLAALLGPDDRVTLIGFARQPRLLAESLAGDRAGQLVELAARTPAEGGTNLEEALRLAGDLARRQWREEAQNRIVLLTDGAANLGDADPARLAAQVEELRRQGVAFDACGVGAEGLDDGVLEALTRKGDGRYQVLNAPEEADAGFARRLAGAFRPAAENVKVQVRFNPARVTRYRLIGFEKHRLREEDFKDDRVDAAELAAEEAAVALYQVEVASGAEQGELGEVAVRFRDPARGEMVERTWTLAYEAQPPAFDRAPASLRLAGTAALLAEKLRGGAPAGAIRLEELAPVAAGLRGAYAGDARVEDFLRMFDQTRRLIGE